MSTKIYEAFLLDMPVEKAITLLGAQRAAIDALVEAKTAKAVAGRSAALIDSWCMARGQGGPMRERLEAVKGDSALWTCASQVAKDQAHVRATSERNPEVDADVLLRLFMDDKKHRVFGFAVEERLGVHAHLMGLAGVRSFAYWNNSDPDENVPAAEWRARGRAWQRVGEPGGPTEFNMEWRAQLMFDAATVTPLLPDLNQRVARRSKDWAQNVHIQRTWSPKSADSLSGVWRAMREAGELLADPNSTLAKERAEYEVFLRQALLPELAPHLSTALVELP